MSVTEFVFPVFKTDNETQAAFKEAMPAVAAFFNSVDGLEHGYNGKIIEENGVPVKDSRERGVFAIEWKSGQAFHDFFPQSEKFQEFYKLVGGFVAGKNLPQLYHPVEGDMLACVRAPITQLFKAKIAEGTTPASWTKLVETVTNQTSSKSSFYQASGIEQDVGTFVGLIGWDSFQDYERFGRGASIQDPVSALGDEPLNIAITFEAFKF